MKLLLSFLLLIPNLCLAQAFTFNQGAPTTKNYYEEIPYEYIKGKIYLNGEIGGRKLRFLFDTGAPVAVSKELAAELGAKELRKVMVTDAHHRSDSTAVFILNAIKLGNLGFDGIPAVAVFPEFYKCLKIDAVIGSNMLRNSIVKIDSKRKLLIITDQKQKLGLVKKNGAEMITKGNMQSDPKIQAYVKQRVHAFATFDSGDSGFLRLNDWLMGQLKPYQVVDSLQQGFGSGGLGVFGAQEGTVKTLYAISSLSIGNAKFLNLRASSSKTENPAFGTKLLEYGILTLDYINNKFYFDAFIPEVDLAQKRWNAYYGFIDSKIVIAEVWDKDSGIEQGTQVLQIDGLDVSQTSLCDYITGPDFLEGKETAEIVLKLKDGAEKKVTIIKK